MKRTLLIVALAMLITAPAIAEVNPMGDVPSDHWAYEAVERLMDRGIIIGYPEGSLQAPARTDVVHCPNCGRVVAGEAAVTEHDTEEPAKQAH